MENTIFYILGTLTKNITIFGIGTLIGMLIGIGISALTIKTFNLLK